MRNLLRQVDAIRREQGARAVREVRVEMGPLAGVEPLLLATAFDQLADGPAWAEAQLVIDQVALTGYCESCHRELEIADFDFRCPDCAGNLNVLRGDQLQLVSVCLSIDPAAGQAVPLRAVP